MSREILFKITCLSCGSDNVKIDTAYDSLWWDDGYIRFFYFRKH